MTDEVIDGTLTINAGTTAATAALTINTGTITSTTASSSGYVVEQDATYDLSSAASGIYFGNEQNSTVLGDPQATAQIWNNFDRMTAQTTSTATAALVNRYVQSVRPDPYGTPGQTLWGAVIEVRDETGLSSKSAGGLLGLEIDLVANGADDGGSSAGSRQGLVISMLGGNGSGAPEEATSAIGIFNGGTGAAGFYTPIEIAAPFRDAGIDMRSMGTMSGSSGHAIWLRSGIDIAFDTSGTAGAAVASIGSNGVGAVISPGIVGTTTTDTAPTGCVGEYVSSTVLEGSAVSLTSQTPAVVTSITLTAGDWDVWGNVAHETAASTNIYQASAWTTTAPGSDPVIPNGGGMTNWYGSVSGAVDLIIGAGIQRFSLSTSTTISLVGYAHFDTSTAAAYGFIGARRVR